MRPSVFHIGHIKKRVVVHQSQLVYKQPKGTLCFYVVIRRLLAFIRCLSQGDAKTLLSPRNIMVSRYEVFLLQTPGYAHGLFCKHPVANRMSGTAITFKKLEEGIVDFFA
ncbi:hypothetical protein MRX96_003176 [Rhipicephalus microplus]